MFPVPSEPLWEGSIWGHESSSCCRPRHKGIPVDNISVVLCDGPNGVHVPWFWEMGFRWLWELFHWGAISKNAYGISFYKLVLPNFWNFQNWKWTNQVCITFSKIIFTWHVELKWSYKLTMQHNVTYNTYLIEQKLLNTSHIFKKNFKNFFNN